MITGQNDCKPRASLLRNHFAILPPFCRQRRDWSPLSRAWVVGSAGADFVRLGDRRGDFVHAAGGSLPSDFEGDCRSAGSLLAGAWLGKWNLRRIGIDWREFWESGSRESGSWDANDAAAKRLVGGLVARAFNPLPNTRHQLTGELVVSTQAVGTGDPALPGFVVGAGGSGGAVVTGGWRGGDVLSREGVDRSRHVAGGGDEDDRVVGVAILDRFGFVFGAFGARQGGDPLGGDVEQGGDVAQEFCLGLIGCFASDRDVKFRVRYRPVNPQPFEQSGVEGSGHAAVGGQQLIGVESGAQDGDHGWLIGIAIVLIDFKRRVGVFESTSAIVCPSGEAA